MRAVAPKETARLRHPVINAEPLEALWGHVDARPQPWPDYLPGKKRPSLRRPKTLYHKLLPPFVNLLTGHLVALRHRCPADPDRCDDQELAPITPEASPPHRKNFTTHRRPRIRRVANDVVKHGSWQFIRKSARRPQCSGYETPQHSDRRWHPDDLATTLSTRADRKLLTPYVWNAVRAEWDRASADQTAEPDEWTGRAHESNDQGCRSQTVPVRQP